MTDCLVFTCIEMEFFNNNVRYPTLENWCLVKTIGSGGTSRVFLGYDFLTQKVAAVKILKKMDTRYLAYVDNEVSLQSILNHSHILKIDGFYEMTTLSDVGGKTQMVTALILENAPNGDILSLIEKIGRFPEKLARTYLHQLIAGLEYLHKNQIAHRDIKPDNLMLDKDYCIKIGDFGCAAKYPNSRHLFTSPAGTSKYFPPEVNSKLPYEGLAVDLFAAAIFLFCMVVGHMPFTSATESDPLYSMIMNGKAKTFWKTHEEILKQGIGEKVSLNSEFKELMNKMFESNPSKRLNIEGIKKSAWYKGSTLERIEMGKFVSNLLEKKCMS